MRKLIANRSIRFKLLLNFVLIIMMSILTIGLIGSTMYKRSIEEETNDYTVQMMSQVKNHIQVNTSEMGNLIYYLSHEQAVLDFMRGGKAGENLLEIDHEIDRIEAVYMARHMEISGILFVGADSQYASSTFQRIARDPLTEESWYKSAVAQPDALHLISHPIGRNIKVDQNLSADQVLSFVQAVRDPLSGTPIGVILIDMKLDIIQQILESVSLGKSGFMFIMDENGDVVYSPVNPIVYRITGEWIDGQSDSFVKTINGRDYQMMYTSFSDIGWRIVGVFPRSESLKVVSDMQMYTVIVALITLVLAFIASWFFTNSIVRPVGKLRSLMKKVEEGELYLRFQSKTNDEIGQLGSSFNNMVMEIENLINLVYHEQREKREAELKILQAQIKPHFLYNTLDTIQWMAQDRDADDIVDIVVALTSLFRISLSKGNEYIPLEEEIQHVESYLIIQMARYEEKLDYSIQIQDSVRTYRVLKIILQPLVENAIYHGIKLKRGSGHIHIEAYESEGKLFVIVEDDGVGMLPDRLAEMNSYLKQGRESHASENKGYGVYNVNERIKLSHGVEYGLTVVSERDSGTKVIICLPVMT